MRRAPFRLEPGTTHRDALIEALAPEHRPIVERLAAGGMPAVRKAVAEEQERAKTEGRPSLSGEPIVALAEGLLPDVKAALWLDRAEAALSHVDELSLRDLRATVMTASARDDAGRGLERQLREALERRVSKLRSDWEQQLEQALTGGRVLQALRLSAKPPEPTARFPASLIERLAAQTSAAMKSDLAPDRWLTLLEAAVACPVRRQVRPAGIPDDPSGKVARQARLAAGRIPALAPMLGMAMPPPPQPLGGGRTTRVPRPPLPRAARPAVPRSPASPEEPVAALPGPSDEPATAPISPEEPVAAALPDLSGEPVPAAGPSDPVAGKNAVIDEPQGETVDEG